MHLTNYVDDATQYVYDLEKLLEKYIDKIFDWFSDIFLKANPDKCHLLTNTDKNVTLKIKNETITNSSGSQARRSQILLQELCTICIWCNIG